MHPSTVALICLGTFAVALIIFYAWLHTKAGDRWADKFNDYKF
jgi:hypothetical protein